jgi:hypothetical protein
MALGKEKRFFFEKFFGQRNFFEKNLCRVLTTLALGKEIFFENFFAKCPSARYSVKKKLFF